MLKKMLLRKIKNKQKDKQQTYSAPAVKAGADEKVTYSRVERAKSLPDTGESSSVAMLVLGAILGTFGLVTVRRKNQNNKKNLLIINKEDFLDSQNQFKRLLYLN